MQNNIRNTNLRFNLDKEQQRRAWEYLQTMDRQDFKSYSQVISLALVDYFDRYYRTQADPYLETREREELFVKQIVDAVENSLKQELPLFLSGLTVGMAQREPQIRASFPTPENSQPDNDVDWDFLGESLLGGEHMTDFLTADTNLPSYMCFPVSFGHGNKRTAKCFILSCSTGQGFPRKMGLVRYRWSCVHLLYN